MGCALKAPIRILVRHSHSFPHLFLFFVRENKKRKRVWEEEYFPSTFQRASFFPLFFFSFRKFLFQKIERRKRKLRPRQEKALFKSGLTRKRSAKIAEIKI